MKLVLIAAFTACMAVGCTEATENPDTIKLPPQDSAIDIDHRVPADSMPVTDTVRTTPVY